MNKILLLGLYGLCVTFKAIGRDITVSDNHFGNGVGSWASFGGSADLIDSRPGVFEDNEVEPLNDASQIWDYEAFIQNNYRLSIVAGFDFKNGAEIPLDGRFYPGDIFLGKNMIRSPSFAIKGYHHYLNNGSSGSWQYVIHFDDGPDGGLHGLQNGDIYNVYALSDDSVLESVYYRSNRDSNPFRYISGGKLITSGKIQIQNGISDTDSSLITGYSFSGGWHNILTVDLHWLNQDTISGPVYLNTTMSCGNDDLRGVLDKFSVSALDSGNTVHCFSSVCMFLVFIARRR